MMYGAVKLPKKVCGTGILKAVLNRAKGKVITLPKKKQVDFDFDLKIDYNPNLTKNFEDYLGKIRNNLEARILEEIVVQTAVVHKKPEAPRRIYDVPHKRGLGGYAGSGAFSRAYYKDDETVVVHSVCPIKEIMSTGAFPDTPLFPKLEKVGEYLYELPRYEVHSYNKNLEDALNSEAYKVYDALWNLPCNNDTNQNWFHRDITKEYFAGLAQEYPELSRVLIEAIDACTPTTVFEICPRNVGVTKEGDLVLFDVFLEDELIHG